jgi:endonuclease/exonuclease/phosphatase family metal-dependent hydrolase
MRRAPTLVPLALALAACTVHRGPEPAPDADPDHPFPPPRSDVVPAIGSEATLELATWNLHNFPSIGNTPARVADLITSLDLDVVVVEEIASEAAWDELIARLPDHEGVLSTHRYTPDDYQKIGIIYRASLVTVGDPTLLFVTDSYVFPRPPFAITITVDGAPIELIGVHLKAGVEVEDAERRRQAVAQLDTFLRLQIDGGGEAKVVLLGDYNERVTSDPDRAVLAPLLAAPDRYTVRTEPPAIAGGVTYLGFGGEFIDHITTTTALDTAWAGAPTVSDAGVPLDAGPTGVRIEAPRLDQMTASYREVISDHLPAILIVPR